ncbi:MAG: serine protease, partial [Planctomycetes bacterium]|nr:serine protease [Planctomycetota bacterium]
MTVPRYLTLASIVLTSFVAGSIAWAQTLSNEKLAELLTANTLTVRVSATMLAKTSKDRAKPAQPNSGKLRPAPAAGLLADLKPSSDVIVCTGIALGDGHVVTFCNAPLAARYRVTLPRGKQAEAILRVVDHYSGLRLLGITGAKLTGLRPADQPPQVGSPVMSAAAEGLERPSISVGIVSANGRIVGQGGLPPLLQCDVRTTETSSGAAIVDAAGRLLGIVAATNSPGEQRGWTYAVPAEHLRRLLAARREGVLIELKRRRPIVGWTLGPGKVKDTVVVERVVKDGPADQAGVVQGAILKEVDGRAIRNTYQAVNLILNKQPGDQVALVCETGNRRENLSLTLGGGAEINPAISSAAYNRRVGNNFFRLDTTVRVNIDNKQIEPAPPRRSQIEMLRGQLDAYQLLILRQQEEIRRLNEELRRP